MGCTDTAKHIGCVAGGVFDLRVKFFTDHFNWCDLSGAKRTASQPGWWILGQKYV